MAKKHAIKIKWKRQQRIYCKSRTRVAKSCERNSESPSSNRAIIFSYSPTADIDEDYKTENFSGMIKL